LGIFVNFQLNTNPMKDLQLENLKVGDKVVSILPKKNGLLKYGAVSLVREWDERCKVWRCDSDHGKNIAAFPPHGGCKSFMSKEIDLYYSANPKHIKAAIKQHDRAHFARQQKEAKDKAKLKEFQVKLDDLLKKYGADIYSIQTSGDDQGVETEVQISIGSASRKLSSN